jgi:hypothetical protein
MTSDSDREIREAAGRHEIKGVMLRAMSLEVDRFESIEFGSIHSFLAAADRGSVRYPGVLIFGYPEQGQVSSKVVPPFQGAKNPEIPPGDPERCGRAREALPAGAPARFAVAPGAPADARALLQERDFCQSYSDMMREHLTECFLQHLPAGDLHDISKPNMIPQAHRPPPRCRRAGLPDRAWPRPTPRSAVAAARGDQGDRSRQQHKAIGAGRLDRGSTGRSVGARSR